jgi:hypothetical protein
MLSDGYPLENLAKTEAQAGRHAPIREIGQRNMLHERNIVLTLGCFYVGPCPLHLCAAAL